MKKLVFLNNIVHPRYEQYLNWLSEKGTWITNLFICSGNEKGNWEYKNIFKYTIKYLKSINIGIPIGSGYFYIYINPTLLFDLFKLNPHVIIISGWDQPSYWIAFLYSKIFRKKVILWSGSTSYENSIFRRLLNPFVKYMIRRVDGIICYGQRSKDYVISLGAKERKTTIVVNNPNTEYYLKTANFFINKKMSSRKKYIQNDLPIFLYVGQLIRRKGIDKLIDAFKDFSNRSNLMIVGDGGESENLKSIVKKEKMRNIYFISRKRMEELPEIFCMSDFFILPSYEEVWGLVVNEAMACGLPVIVSKNAGCCPDLVYEGYNGYSFNPYDNRDLKVKMQKLLDNPKKASIMGKNSLKLIKDINKKSVLSFDRYLNNF